MKVVILAGGIGSRMIEESYFKPKPMVEIGGKPLLWHIMKQYYHYGFDDFIICVGYKGDYIKEYFSRYYLRNCDITFDFSNNGAMTIHQNATEKWKVTVVDTGEATQTGGRVKRVASYLGNNPFMLTYGDGVSDIDLAAINHFHNTHGKMLTITAIRPNDKFGIMSVDKNSFITAFIEKPERTGYINGGFMVINPEFLDLIEGDSVVLEKYPLEEVARRGELVAFKHEGYWQCMDTMKEKQELEDRVITNNAPWIKW